MRIRHLSQARDFALSSVGASLHLSSRPRKTKGDGNLSPLPIITTKEKRSTSALYSQAFSGALYSKIPLVPGRGSNFFIALTRQSEPRSRIIAQGGWMLTTPRFAGFVLRWTQPAEYRTLRPSRICINKNMMVCESTRVSRSCRIPCEWCIENLDVF